VLEDRLKINQTKDDWLDGAREEMQLAIEENAFKNWTQPKKVEELEKKAHDLQKSLPIKLEKGKMIPIEVKMIHSTASNLLESGFS